MSGLRTAVRDGVLLLTIDRPERMNSIDPATNDALREAWLEFRDDDALAVAIVTGAGDRSFSAGNDLRALAEGASPSQAPFGGLTRDYTTYKPIIAAINGWAAGGGLELALACDIRIASNTAQFVLSEVRWGLMAAVGGSQRLARLVPPGVALDMLLTAEPIDAEAALRWGLVSRVTEPAALLDTALAMATRIGEMGPVAVRASKEAVVRGVHLPLADGLDLELEVAEAVHDSQDAKEGPRAFAEKRKPRFAGR